MSLDATPPSPPGQSWPTPSTSTSDASDRGVLPAWSVRRTTNPLGVTNVESTVSARQPFHAAHVGTGCHVELQAYEARVVDDAGVFLLWTGNVGRPHAVAVVEAGMVTSWFETSDDTTSDQLFETLKGS